MKIVCVSDLHMATPVLPKGHLLVCAGDLTSTGTEREIKTMVEWLSSQADSFPAGVIFIAGNHDFLFQDEPKLAYAMLTHPKLHYLENSGMHLGNLNFWGSPYTPRFYDWAFMKHDAVLANMWSQIPRGTDILITHGPARGILDTNKRGDHCGSWSLADVLPRISIKYHIFGHIHESNGFKEMGHYTAVNAAIMDHMYSPENPAWVIDTDSGIVYSERLLDV